MRDTDFPCLHQCLFIFAIAQSGCQLHAPSIWDDGGSRWTKHPFQHIMPELLSARKNKCTRPNSAVWHEGKKGGELHSCWISKYQLVLEQKDAGERSVEVILTWREITQMTLPGDVFSWNFFCCLYFGLNLIVCYICTHVGSQTPCGIPVNWKKGRFICYSTFPVGLTL